MIIRIINDNSERDRLEEVFHGDIKEGARTLMDYTYKYALLCHGKGFVSMEKAFNYIVEEWSIYEEDEAIIRVYLDNGIPDFATLYVYGEKEADFDFMELVL